MDDSFYITTPIYYVNARPHLGHAYTTIVADVAARVRAMQGKETFFLTGTDEHGDKIVRAAKKENISPRDYVDHISQLFSTLWRQLNIGNNAFIRTTEKAHIAIVKKVLQKIYDAGEIYFSQYSGMYCFGCERFYTDRELVDGKCPDHNTKPEEINESNYFFRMGKYQDWLIEHINSHPEFIRPQRYRNEVLSFLKEPLGDLCISRPKTRLKWGITLPFDQDYVTYVWFDALINYISALGYPDGELFQKYWPVAQHVVAKDIIKPHGIYWPIMLKAAGIPVYKHLNVHGYWNVDQSKMSKSIGNVVEPLELKNIYGLDPFRFFLLRDMVFGLDSNFSKDALIQRINTELANDLGNLFSRTLAMVHKYFDGRSPVPPPADESKLGHGVESQALAAIDAFEESMVSFAFHKGLAAVWEFIGHLNKYIDTTAPWKLAKKESARPQLKGVIYNLLEGLRILSGLLYPVMPDTAVTMQKQLGLGPDHRLPQPFYTLDKLRKWGLFPRGIAIPEPITLFPRIDVKKTGTANLETNQAQKELPDIKPEISFDDFSKIDLRVATVVKAETVPRAKKLLKLEVDLGEQRTIVAGIKETYNPDDLVGRQVIIVANLKPAKLMGIRSKGMLLAVIDGNKCALGTLNQPMTPGLPLK